MSNKATVVHWWDRPTVVVNSVRSSILFIAMEVLHFSLLVSCVGFILQTKETPCVGQLIAVTTSGLSMRASADHSRPRVEPSFGAQLERSV